MKAAYYETGLQGTLKLLFIVNNTIYTITNNALNVIITSIWEIIVAHTESAQIICLDLLIPWVHIFLTKILMV